MNPDSSISEIVFDPIISGQTVFVIGALLVGLTIWGYVTVGRRIGWWKNGLLLVLRSVGIILLMLILMRPSRQEELPPVQTDKSIQVALDLSASMNQTDVEAASRLDAAKKILIDSRLFRDDGQPGANTIKPFAIGNSGRPMAGTLHEQVAEDKSTRFHQSVGDLVGHITPGTVKAVVLVTDGHDFEYVNPSRTGFLARSRRAPIFAVPVGKAGKAKDVSVRLTSYLPYTYVKQKAVISANLRLIGCEYEDLEVRLLRQGKTVETRRLKTEDNHQMQVKFTVEEEEPGQVEYEIAARPLRSELNTDNNSAITFLNVISKKITLLILEGAPYWDTTFLQRSLMRNDKFNVDSIVQYAPKRARRIRKEESETPLKVPGDAESFSYYDAVILGRKVEQLLSKTQLDALEKYARDYEGTVIFSRGPAFGGELAQNELQPVVWGDGGAELDLSVSREGRSLAPFRLLADRIDAGDELPAVIGGRAIKDPKPLTTTLAWAGEPDDQLVSGIVHRRFGSGQVVSVGVDGLWRWGFNSKIDSDNTLFDRFWDQMVLWLLAGRGTAPNEQFSLRTSTANVLLGEKIYFRLSGRGGAETPRQLQLQFTHKGKTLEPGLLTPPNAETRDRLVAEFLPASPGKYQALAKMPDGTQLQSRFVVFEDNPEETEVAVDIGYLRKLCASSGGRILEPSELLKLLEDLKEEQANQQHKNRLKPLWDETWVFYLTGMFFVLDWFLRRRWGLC